MKTILLVCVMSLVSGLQSLKAGTVLLDFDGTQAPGTGKTIPYIDEDGFRVKPFGPIGTVPPYNLALYGPNVEMMGNNGSAHLSLLIGNSLEVFHLGGSLFDAKSVDLSEYSTVYPFPKTIGFEGVLANGSIVTTSFTTDGHILGRSSLQDFQTFHFPSSFSNLQLLRATTDLFGLDNLSLTVVPEPSTWSLLGLGAVVLLGSRMRCRERNKEQ